MTRRDLPSYVYAKKVKGKTYYRFARGAVSGRMSRAMIAKYAGIARQIMLAKSAIAKRGA